MDHANAERMRSRLSQQGEESILERINKNGLVLHRVRIGPLSGIDGADQISARLRGHGFDPKLIVE